MPRPRSANANSTPYMSGMFANIDYVPCTIPLSEGIGKLIIFEDNDAVIKMCIKGRSPAMRHVARTHRIDLDWLWERMRTDPGVFIKYVGTKEQIADMFTKGAFTAETWRNLCTASPQDAHGYLKGGHTTIVWTLSSRQGNWPCGN